MSDFRVASRYAKSLLELSNEQGVLEEVNDDMKLFNEVCKENFEFVLMLRNPVIKADKKKAILDKVFTGKVNKLTLAIFEIMTRKNREGILPQVAIEFRRQYNTLRKIGVATVTTAAALTEELRGEMKEMAAKISGKKDIELKEIIDDEIIGGYILKMGDQQIDDSIRTKLNTLAKEVSHKHYVREI
ncbi:MAG: ATP synthase F1 subunit delta [Cyclobacteriaceae bacterium]